MQRTGGHFFRSFTCHSPGLLEWKKACVHDILLMYIYVNKDMDALIRIRGLDNIRRLVK